MLTPVASYYYLISESWKVENAVYKLVCYPKLVSVYSLCKKCLSWSDASLASFLHALLVRGHCQSHWAVGSSLLLGGISTLYKVVSSSGSFLKIDAVVGSLSAPDWTYSSSFQRTILFRFRGVNLYFIVIGYNKSAQKCSVRFFKFILERSWCNKNR